MIKIVNAIALGIQKTVFATGPLNLRHSRTLRKEAMRKDIQLKGGWNWLKEDVLSIDTAQCDATVWKSIRPRLCKESDSFQNLVLYPSLWFRRFLVRNRRGFGMFFLFEEPDYFQHQILDLAL